MLCCFVQLCCAASCSCFFKLCRAFFNLMCPLFNTPILDTPSTVSNFLFQGLLGGVTSVTLARSEVRSDGKKQVLMRKYVPLFDLVLELRSRSEWYVHQNVAHSVDAYLRRESYPVLRTTPGKAEPVTAIPTEDGFVYEPPLSTNTSEARTPFDFGQGPITLGPTFSSR